MILWPLILVAAVPRGALLPDLVAEAKQPSVISCPPAAMVGGTVVLVSPPPVPATVPTACCWRIAKCWNGAQR